MKKLLLATLALGSSSVFAQIEYPGYATVGSSQTVFDYSTNKCETEDIPDAPARAFRDASGKINLIATHFINRRMTGNDFNSLTQDCNIIMSSHQDSDPSTFNNKEWIVAPYTTDGKTVHAIVHNEYVPCGNSTTCWYNGLTYVASNDSGKTYAHTTAPSHLVAASPYKSPYPTTHVPFGIFGGSNIIKKDGYYYKFVQVEAYQAQDWGAGLIRTSNLSDPTSWRGWDGSGFNVQFVNPYTATGYNATDKVLAPVSRDQIGKMCASVTYNTFFGKYIMVDFTVGEVNGTLKYGFYYSLSNDLINWSTKQYIMAAQQTWAAGGSNYPSLIDHNDTTRNFEQTGETCYLYYTKWNSGTYDRDLVRVPVTFAKRSVSSFVINSTGNQDDGTPGDGLCKTTGNVCTFRAAIQESNARPFYDGYDTLALPITFSISGSGVQTIKPATYLPEIFYPLYIDGYTQTGGTANTNNFIQGLNTNITVLLDAEDGGAHALAFHCGNNTIKGLSVINGNIDFLYEDGYSKSTDGNTIQGCFIGMGTDGATPYYGALNFNNQHYNVIGGTSNAMRNLVGGGVIFTKSNYNTVQGNYFGATSTGIASSGTGEHSIQINDSSSYNEIGGTNTNARNLISGGNLGVSITGSQAHHNSVLGNYIGVAIDGSTALGNGRSGINLSDSTHHNTIGSGNVIAANSNDEAGIWMDNVYSNTIQSNYIGTDVAMTASIGNGAPGNFSAGIMILGNSHDNMIGGWLGYEGNVIANNNSHGIAAYANVGNGNAILSNLIYNNVEMGIDLLADDAPNGNDDKDDDSGPNDLQNFPVLNGAYASANDIIVSGTLNSKPNASYTLQYFYNSACDGTGNGEGQALIGAETVTTDASGNAGFFKSFNITVSVGAYVSALATDASNNTSEFSVCQIVNMETAVNKINAFQAEVYPSNATDHVYVISENEFTYGVYDQQGKLVLQGNSKTEKTSIDVGALNQGIYFLKLQGTTWTDQKKIIKE